MRDAMIISRRGLLMGIIALAVAQEPAMAQIASQPTAAEFRRARRRDAFDRQQQRDWQRRRAPVDLSGESRVPGVGAPSRPIPPSGPGSMTVPNR